MSRNDGASASRPGSHEPSPKGLGPSGFDPSRVRAWLVGMTRQGEDNVWRGAEKALAYFDTAEARLAAVRRVIEYGYTRTVGGRPVNPLKNGELCEHRRHEWEDCIGCYDEALIAALTCDSDGPRMAETGTGSGRSRTSAGRQASPQTPSLKAGAPNEENDHA